MRAAHPGFAESMITVRRRVSGRAPDTREARIACCDAGLAEVLRRQ